MCKIIAFTDTKKLKLNQCVNDIGNTLLKSERDGFGYAIEGKNGVFGEKTIAKHFKSRLSKKSIQLPILKRRYMSFGIPSELTGAGIFHGRTSTNSEGLVNTHPMIRPNEDGLWYLIHNGVVDDMGPEYSKLTDNDSEDVLYRLIEGVKNTDNPMSEIESYLEGYYAFACIDPLGRLHVARDGYATLFMAWSEELNTFILATTESLLNKLNKMLDAKIGPIDEIEDDVYMIFEGNTLVYHQFIQPLGFTVTQSAKSGASLGRELSPQATGDLSGGNRLSTISLNGGEVIVRSPHHRPMSEADWRDQERMDNEAFQAALDSIPASDDVDSEDNELDLNDYALFKREIENLDDTYTICDADGIYLKLHEFRKLDPISQEMCTIIRDDGTVICLDDDLHFSARRA